MWLDYQGINLQKVGRVVWSRQAVEATLKPLVFRRFAVPSTVPPQLFPVLSDCEMSRANAPVPGSAKPVD
jgi:hypothetical protein